MFVCRDFVCIRQMEISGGSLYAASKTIVTALKPEQPGKVRSDTTDTVCMYVCMYVQAVTILYLHYRAENGPCGYLVIPISANQCKFVWVLNSNLKVRTNCG